MGYRCTKPSARIQLEALEDRLTPAKLSLSLGLSLVGDIGRIGPPSHSNGLALGVQSNNGNSQGFGLGQLTHLVFVDLNIRFSTIRFNLDFNPGKSVWTLTIHFGNRNGEAEVDARDKSKGSTPPGKQTPGADTPSTPSIRSPALLAPPAPGNSPAQHRSPAQPDRAAIRDRSGAEAASTRGVTPNALLVPAAGGRNALETQVQPNQTNPHPVPVNPTVTQADLPFIPTPSGSAAAPPKEELSLPLVGGSNARELLPVPTPEELWMPELENAEPIVPVLPDLIDQFMEWAPGIMLPEWLRETAAGHPYWAYTLLAAGTVGAGWLTANSRPRRVRDPRNFQRPEDEIPTDGFPA